jgi:hypothetical protein
VAAAVPCLRLPTGPARPSATPTQVIADGVRTKKEKESEEDRARWQQPVKRQKERKGRELAWFRGEVPVPSPLSVFKEDTWTRTGCGVLGERGMSSLQETRALVRRMSNRLGEGQ